MNTDADIALPGMIPDGEHAKEGDCRRSWFTPYPHLKGQPVTRFLVRSVLSLAGSRIAGIAGTENVSADKDPFILVLNHSTALEALLIPAALVHLRRGKRVHFLADWNFLLIPPVGLFYKCGEVIPVTTKPARPRFLNRLKPMLTGRVPTLVRAREALRQKRSIAIFPEATRNHSPHHLLAGQPGAARLSLSTGVPILPAGVVYQSSKSGRTPGTVEPFNIRFGPALHPPMESRNPTHAEVQDWHATVMRALSKLCGKPWIKDLNL